MSAPVREASVRSCPASGGNDKTPVDCPADLRPDCPSPLPGKMTPDNSTDWLGSPSGLDRELSSPTSSGLTNGAVRSDLSYHYLAILNLPLTLKLDVCS